MLQPLEWASTPNLRTTSWGIEELVKYQQALAAIFLEGILFVILAFLGVQQTLIKPVPRSIMLATSAGFGLFLAFTDLLAQQGLGVVTSSETNVVAFGGCPAKYQSQTYIIKDPESVCSVKVTSGTTIADLGFPSPAYR